MIYDEREAIENFVKSLGTIPPISLREQENILKEKWVKFVIDFLKKDERATEEIISQFNELSMNEKLEAIKNTIFDFNCILEIYNNAIAQFSLTQNLMNGGQN